MDTWVVTNQKGGVGKTTTAVSIADLLAESGKKTILIDLDPHASVTYYFDYEPDELKSSLYDLLINEQLQKSDVQASILPSSIHDLDILPASLALATMDKLLGKQKGMGLRLKKVCDLIADDYDFAIIDCPPILGVLMINALAAAKRVILPVQTEFLAIKGLERMLKTMNMVYKQPANYPPTLIVPTMFDKRTRASVESLRAMRQDYPEFIWRGVIPVDTHFRDASKNHLVPTQNDPLSRGVSAYRQLVKDIEKGTDNQYQHRLKAV